MPDVNEWREAVLDACSNAHLGGDMNDPRSVLDRLIEWHVEVALDPRVSERAQALAGQPHAHIDSEVEAKAKHISNMGDGYTKVGYVMRGKRGDHAIVYPNNALWLSRYELDCLRRQDVKWGRE